MIPVLLTPCFSWVWKGDGKENRFNGLARAFETVETVPITSSFIPTQLKQGVNEKFIEFRWRAYEITGLTKLPHTRAAR
jgi:hypothetical protein